MTEKQIPRAIRVDVKIVSFVRAFRRVYDRGPSLREIMLETGATGKTSVSRAVARLVAVGRLARDSDGLTVPGDVEAAVALLKESGWVLFEPAPGPERNGNYPIPEDMVHLLGKMA